MTITASVRTADRTGVEMEALTSVSVAALTLVDMIKAVDKGAVITDVRLEAKDGGKSGTLAARTIRALAITVSNRARPGYTRTVPAGRRRTAPLGRVRRRGRPDGDPGRRGGRAGAARLGNRRVRPRAEGDTQRREGFGNEIAFCVVSDSRVEDATREHSRAGRHAGASATYAPSERHREYPKLLVRKPMT